MSSPFDVVLASRVHVTVYGDTTDTACVSSTSAYLCLTTKDLECFTQESLRNLYYLSFFTDRGKGQGA